MSAQVAADLRAAAEVLRRDGWHQGRYHSGQGCHCAIGAVAVAISGTKRPNPDKWVWGSKLTARLRPAKEVLASIVGHEAASLPGIAVVAWNDTPGRTADEVIAALEAAADAAEAQS